MFYDFLTGNECPLTQKIYQVTAFNFTIVQLLQRALKLIQAFKTS